MANNGLSPRSDCTVHWSEFYINLETILYVQQFCSNVSPLTFNLIYVLGRKFFSKLTKKKKQRVVTKHPIISASSNKTPKVSESSNETLNYLKAVQPNRTIIINAKWILTSWLNGELSSFVRDTYEL